MMKKRTKIQFYGACEGLQEIKYLKRLQFLLNNDENRKYDVNFNFEDTNGGGIVELCKQATKKARLIDIDKAKKEGKIVAIFDYDFRNDEFKKAVLLCDKENVLSAYSNVNFDLWLILHKENYKSRITKTNGYHKELRKIYNLDSKADVKKEDVINKIMNQIELEDVKNAILNAKKLASDALNENIYFQPYTKMAIFLERVFKEINIKI